MTLTKRFSPRPSNLLGAGLIAGASVLLSLWSQRNNPAPTPGKSTAMSAVAWGAVGYALGSLIELPKSARLSDYTADPRATSLADGHRHAKRLKKASNRMSARGAKASSSRKKRKSA